jgi:hypothetical protein
MISVSIHVLADSLEDVINTLDKVREDVSKNSLGGHSAGSIVEPEKPVYAYSLLRDLEEKRSRK